MLEITSKEQILKNIRKGLIQPVPNAYPLLDNESLELNLASQPNDEAFLKAYSGEDNFFCVSDNFFDFTATIIQLQNLKQWSSIHASEQSLITALEDNGLIMNLPDKKNTAFLTTCSSLSPESSTVFFSDLKHNLTEIENASVLLVYAKSNQIQDSGSHSILNSGLDKANLLVSFDLKRLNQSKVIYLFLDVS